MTTLHLLQIREDRLLDQPVRRAVDRLGDTFEAFARSIIELHAEGGGGHAGGSPADLGKAVGNQTGTLQWMRHTGPGYRSGAILLSEIC